MALPKKMKAVGFYKYLPITHPESLLDLEVDIPPYKQNEVLIEVKASSVNPIDIKKRMAKLTVETEPRITGRDGAGVVVAKGAAVNSFNVGDEVIFIGGLDRFGSNAQYLPLDQILVGPKPKTLTYEQAAAMPHTSVTAYESLYDRMLISEKDKGKTLLIINSGGGVGSVASQLAKNTGLKVIGTASRPETKAFSLDNGCDIVLDHTQDLIPQLAANGYENGVEYILVNYDPYPYWDTLMKAVKAQGTICLIVDSTGLVDLRPLKDKSAKLVSEVMLTRLKYDTEDKYKYAEILKEVSQLLDEGKLKTTLMKTLSPINAANVKEGHKLLEGRSLVGKLVLSGF